MAALQKRKGRHCHNYASHGSGGDNYSPVISQLRGAKGSFLCLAASAAAADAAQDGLRRDKHATKETGGVGGWEER